MCVCVCVCHCVGRVCAVVVKYGLRLQRRAITVDKASKLTAATNCWRRRSWELVPRFTSSGVLKLGRDV